MPLLKFAFQNLCSRPMRSALALLGLMVAIAGMVGLFSVAVGLERTVSETFDRVPGLSAMQPDAPIPLFSKLPASWVDEIRNLPCVEKVRAEVWTRANVIEGKQTFNPPRFLFGTDIAATLALRKAIFRDDIIEGRFLTTDDIGSYHCVISQSIAKDANAVVGDVIDVDGNPLEIVGIYSTGSILLDIAIIIDMSSARRMYRLDPTLVSSIYIEPKPGMNLDQAADEIQAHFRGRGRKSWTRAAGFTGLAAAQTWEVLLGQIGRTLDTGITFRPVPPLKRRTRKAPETPAAPTNASATNPGLTRAEARKAKTDEGIMIRTASDWGEQIDKFSGDLDLFLYLMNMIGVVIALLSILNTMLMSVSERMTEFGVLKANGWTNLDLMKLITFEAVLLGFAGGLLGCGVGWTCTVVINRLLPDKLNLYASPGLLLFSLGFSMALGVIGALYPAIWATRMTPMQAIRRM